MEAAEAAVTIMLMAIAVAVIGLLCALRLIDYRRRIDYESNHQVGITLSLIIILVVMAVAISILPLMYGGHDAAGQPQAARSISTVITKSGSHP